MLVLEICFARSDEPYYPQGGHHEGTLDDFMQVLNIYIVRMESVSTRTTTKNVIIARMRHGLLQLPSVPVAACPQRAKLHTR